MDTKLDIKNLSKSFGELTVLDGISLTLPKGENISVLGRSGVGKSVLIKCIIRLIDADTGEIFVNGKDILEAEGREEVDKIREGIGFLFQGGALYDSMTVRNNVAFPLRRRKKKRDESVDELVDQALESVGLKESGDKFPSDLSGGMVKRVALARTIVRKPGIILYDEPTTGLDPVTGREIVDLIIKIQEEYDTSSVIVTHDLECARRTSNDIKLLHEGKFYAEGSFDELRQSEEEHVKRFFTDYNQQNNN